MPEDDGRIRPRTELREWPNARTASSLSTARQIDINQGITRRRRLAARLAVSEFFLSINWSSSRRAKFSKFCNV